MEPMSAAAGWGLGQMAQAATAPGFRLDWDKLLTALGPAAFQAMMQPPQRPSLQSALGPVVPMMTRPVPARPIAPFLDLMLGRR